MVLSLLTLRSLYVETYWPLSAQLNGGGIPNIPEIKYNSSEHTAQMSYEGMIGAERGVSDQ